MSLTKKSVTLLIVIFSLFIGIGLFVVNVVQAEEPEQMQVNNLLTNYFNALKNSDVEGVMKHCIDARGNEKENRDFYTEIFQDNKFIPAAIESKNLHKVKAGLYNVDLYIQYKDGHSEEAKDFKIVKIKGEWKAYITPDPYEYNLEKDLEMIKDTKQSHTA